MCSYTVALDEAISTAERAPCPLTRPIIPVTSDSSIATHAGVRVDTMPVKGTRDIVREEVE